MKKIISLVITLTIMITTGMSAFAVTSQDALNFFNNYVKAANTYSNTLTTMYAPDAKIIRQVVKPDGGLANAYTNTATYITQMKIGQATAKMRGYTNSYSNIKVTQVGKDTFKISSLRQPKGETYKLKAYMIVKPVNGKLQIVEELMQTKEQIFLRYAK